MGELGFDLGSIIWQLVAFLILLYLLYRFLYKPTLKMLDTRAAQVREANENAELARRRAEAAQREYEQSVEEARRRSQEIMAEAAEAAERARRDMQEQARRDAAKLIEEARQQIELERKQALAAVRDDIVDLSIEAARRVLQESIDENMQRRLVEQFLSEQRGDGPHVG